MPESIANSIDPGQIYRLLWVCCCYSCDKIKCFIWYIAEDKLDELKIIFLEEEIKELKHALRESRNRNTYLTQVVEQNEENKKKQ